MEVPIKELSMLTCCGKIENAHKQRYIWNQKTWEEQCDAARHGRSALMMREHNCTSWRPQHHNDVEGQKEAIIRYRREQDENTDVHYILELYEHLQGIGLLPPVAHEKKFDRGPVLEEIRILIDRARSTESFLGHKMVVGGGDPIYPEELGGPSAAAARVQRPRGSPWAQPPTHTPVVIRGYRFSDSSTHPQMVALRDQTIADLQAVLQDDFDEEEIRRLL